MTQPHGRSPLLLATVRVIVAGGLFILVLRGGVWTTLSQVLVQSPWLPLLFTVPSLLGVFVEAERLRLLLRCQGISVPRARLARLVTAAAFFGACVPGGTGGDVLKFFYLPREGQRPRSTLLATLLADRAVGLTSILLTAFACASVVLTTTVPLDNTGWLLFLPLAGLVAVAIGVGLLWSRSQRVTRFRRALVTLLPLQESIAAFFDALTLLRDHPVVLLRATVWSTLGTITLATVFAVAGWVLVPDLSGWVVAALALVGMIANAIPITPGGLGVGEAAFAGIFGLAGGVGGAPLIVLWRIGMLPVIVAGGLIYALGGARAAPSVGPSGVSSSSETQA